MFADLTGRLAASRPPVSNTDGSRPKGGVVYGGEIPSREPVDPQLASGASQRCRAQWLYHTVV